MEGEPAGDDPAGTGETAFLAPVAAPAAGPEAAPAAALAALAEEMSPTAAALLASPEAAPTVVEAPAAPVEQPPAAPVEQALLVAAGAEEELSATAAALLAPTLESQPMEVTPHEISPTAVALLAPQGHAVEISPTAAALLAPAAEEVPASHHGAVVPSESALAVVSEGDMALAMRQANEAMESFSASAQGLDSAAPVVVPPPPPVPVPPPAVPPAAAPDPTQEGLRIKAIDLGLTLSDEAYSSLMRLPKEHASELLDFVRSKLGELRDPSNYIVSTVIRGFNSRRTAGPAPGPVSSGTAAGLPDVVLDGLQRCAASGCDVDDLAKQALGHLPPHHAVELLDYVIESKSFLRNPSSYISRTVSRGFISRGTGATSGGPAAFGKGDAFGKGGGKAGGKYDAQGYGYGYDSYGGKGYPPPAPHPVAATAMIPPDATALEQRLVSYNLACLSNGRQAVDLISYLALRCVPPWQGGEIMAALEARGAQLGSPASYIQASVANSSQNAGRPVQSVQPPPVQPPPVQPAQIPPSQVPGNFAPPMMPAPPTHVAASPVPIPLPVTAPAPGVDTSAAAQLAALIHSAQPQNGVPQQQAPAHHVQHIVAAPYGVAAPLAAAVPHAAHYGYTVPGVAYGAIAQVPQGYAYMPAGVQAGAMVAASSPVGMTAIPLPTHDVNAMASMGTVHHHMGIAAYGVQAPVMHTAAAPTAVAAPLPVAAPVAATVMAPVAVPAPGMAAMMDDPAAKRMRVA